VDKRWVKEHIFAFREKTLVNLDEKWHNEKNQALQLPYHNKTTII